MRRRLFSGSRQRRKAASGQVVIESIASILIFTMMLALIMTITIWLYLQQAMVTAAREGARQASLNSDMGAVGTQASGANSVKSYVQNSVLQLTGQTISTADVDVDGPNGATIGDRTVTVTVSMDLDNPIGLSGFINALGGDGSAFETIPISASATMRYEE